MNSKTICIIAAMENEIKALISYINDYSTETKQGISVSKGTIGKHKVVIALSGVGKVNAARCTQVLIDFYKPDFIINTGIAGGLAPDLSIGNLVIATGVLQHDFDISYFGHVKGHLSIDSDGTKPTIFYTDKELNEKIKNTASKIIDDKKIKNGYIATGDQFISNLEVKQEIYNLFKATAVEMECSAIGQVAYLNNMPFVVMKVISDLADGTSVEIYDEFEKQTEKLSTSIIKDLIDNL